MPSEYEEVLNLSDDIRDLRLFRQLATQGTSVKSFADENTNPFNPPPLPTTTPSLAPPKTVVQEQKQKPNNTWLTWIMIAVFGILLVIVLLLIYYAFNSMKYPYGKYKY